ncbi:MAG: PQQ-dependent sugar dehydrogenase [Sphingomonas sp.]|uniref:PQQ-dependent sugar dehydrogenase n=1 Tax=Sphingomonas sp. TaxID=28214 RepID=UPI001AD3F037|nr:PQQ-dependent sugar dehydrogenase [Sphingomonas sp.]MBN8813854.1 PQQ-dependent sugar dehydrogenase [Sphingomonas sp.]
MRSLSYLTLPVLLAIGGCGDGGGTTPTPTPTNTAPTFTSAATASVVENTALTYQAAATDAEANAITYSISGGADAGKFTLSGTGALSFNSAPNFDLPGDANGDNVYEVQLRASDGSLTSTLDLRVTVSNSREGIEVRRIATGLNQPMMLAPIPGDNATMFLIERGGNVYRFTTATGAKTLITTVPGVTTDGERGLLGIAARPDFATTGGFVVYATDTTGAIRIIQYTVNPASFAVTGSTTLLTVPHPTNSNHNGGWLGFGPDGLLYIATGDGGGSGDPAGNAQNTNSRLGKMLRVAVSAAGVVTVPAGNPFAGGGGDPYVYALGLRNPFRNAFDGNRLIIADVGEGRTEEIDLLGITDPGRNFGWNFKEGTATFQGTPPAGLSDPVSQYAHGSGPRQGNAIIGGLVYNGPIASLKGSYVFADEVSGNLWTVPAASLVAGSMLASSSYERRNADFAPDAGTINMIVDFAADNAGNLYIVDLDGDIFVAEPFLGSL